MSEERKISKESYMIHGMMKSKKWDYSHHVVPPLSASVTYRLDSIERGHKGFESFIDLHNHKTDEEATYIYDRLDEPTRSMLEDQLAYAEDGEVGLCFATGMAAISAALLFRVQRDDMVLIHNTMYGCTYSLTSYWFPRFGIKSKYIDMSDLQCMKENLTPEVKAIYFETPCNPTIELIDIEAVVSLVKEANKTRDENDNIFTVVDNTFATPRCQRPLNLGIDIVVHSLTKNIGGFGTDMGGAIITSQKFENDLMLFRKDFGGVLGSKNAWPILVYGLSTLIERGRKQQDSAMKIAKYLENCSQISKVSYPGLPSFPQYELAQKQMINFEGKFAPGNMIYFTLLDDSEDNCNKLLNFIAKNSYAMTLAVSLGHIRTLIEKPGSLTHCMIPEEEQVEARMGKSGIRLSIGLEHPTDLIADLEEALNHLG